MNKYGPLEHFSIFLSSDLIVCPCVAKEHMAIVTFQGRDSPISNDYEK